MKTTFALAALMLAGAPVASASEIWGCGSGASGILAPPGPTGLFCKKMSFPGGLLPIDVQSGVSAGFYLMSSGMIHRSGWNTHLLGGNTTMGQLSISDAPINPTWAARSLAIAGPGGSYHMAAICSDGTLFTWGRWTAGYYYGLGRIETSDAGAATPKRVTLNGLAGGPLLMNIVQAACSRDATYAVNANGGVHAFGLAENGRRLLGNINAPTPKPVFAQNMLNFPTTTRIKKACAGLNHALFLDDRGQVWTLGINNEGQRGNGTMGPSTIHDPTRVLVGATTPLSDVVDIAAGHTFSVALKSDGTVWAWGLGAFGVFGTNAPSPFHTNLAYPTQIAGLSNIVAIGTAKYTIYAADGLGALYGTGQAWENAGRFLGNHIPGQAVANVATLQNMTTATTLNPTFVRMIHSGYDNPFFLMN